MKKRLKSLVAFYIVFATCVNAQMQLPAIFGDNMVLQQQSLVPIWGKAKPNTTIKISNSWSKDKQTTTSNNKGEWRTKIGTPKAGGPYNITINDGKAITLKNVMIGEVWLCAGQSNMEMPMKGFPAQHVEGSNNAILRSKNPNIRLITVPRASKTTPQNDFKAQWQMAEPQSVGNFSATGYYFGKLLNDIVDVPIGLICVSYGGSCIEAWMSPETSQPFENTPLPQPTDSIKSPNRTPTVLFNGMLNPVIGYGIRGAIWYQGETNYQNPDGYPTLLKTMVNDWRQRWQLGEFPFYITQIAPYNYKLLVQNDTVAKHNSAYLREAQLKASTSITNSGMAVLLDAGEESNIHPAKKQIPGERLAYLALAKTYGIAGFAAESPTPNEIAIKDSTVTINFNNTPNGITTYGKKVTLFEIAGNDKVFVPADVQVRRKSVIVSSQKVPAPKYVRYAFKDFVEAEIFNTEGLPLTSFRTDL
jgi:sialate O-acetylesterase